MFSRAQYEEEATLAVSTIRSFLTHGSNHISDSDRVDFQRGNAIRAAVPIIALHNALRGINPKEPIFAKLNLLALKKYGYGQCGELAQAAFIHLVEKKIYPIDFCNTTQGGHSLVILGRAPNSDPNDITTWGDIAMICDVWANQVYPLSDFRKMQHKNDNSHYNPAIYEELESEIPPFHLNGELSIQYSAKTPQEAKKFIESAKVHSDLMSFFDTKIESDIDLEKDMKKMNKMLAALKNSILVNNIGALPAILQAEGCLKSLKVGLQTREENDLKSKTHESPSSTTLFKN